MLLFLLVIFGILLEVIIIGGGLYLVSKQTKSKPKNIKITAPVRPIELPTHIKTTFSQPPISIYTSDTLRERPVKHSDGDLVPYGLSDSDREILEMFYEDN